MRTRLLSGGTWVCGKTIVPEGLTGPQLSFNFTVRIFYSGGIVMVFVGIDVAKDKHDCFIISSEGEVLAEVFTITNNRAGFECLLLRIRSCLCWPFTIYLPIRPVHKRPCPHGKARFALSSVRNLYRNKIRLSLGSYFCHLPCQETCRRKTL